MAGINNLNIQSEGWKVFQQFKTIADDEDVGGRTVLRMGEGGHDVTTGGDFIGNVGRVQKTQERNNEVRTTFLKAVKDMYGGSLDDVPQTVKDALELHNFAADANGTATTGRPLSVRRVRAVLTAVVESAGGEKLLKELEEHRRMSERLERAHTLLSVWDEKKGVRQMAMVLKGAFVMSMQHAVKETDGKNDEEAADRLLWSFVHEELQRVRDFVLNGGSKVKGAFWTLTLQHAYLEQSPKYHASEGLDELCAPLEFIQTLRQKYTDAADAQMKVFLETNLDDEHATRSFLDQMKSEMMKSASL